MSVAVAGCYSFNVQLLHLLLYAGLSRRTGGHEFFNFSHEFFMIARVERRSAGDKPTYSSVLNVDT
jgi:hypothetical protein